MVYKLLIFYNKSEIEAAIYFTYYNEMAEIFGLDFKDNKYHEDIARNLLCFSFNKMTEDHQKHLTYFATDKESVLLINLDMNFISGYLLYLIKV